LEETHTDAKRYKPISIPSDIPPINPPEYQMEVCAKWKEVEEAVRKGRASSSPGPYGSSVHSVQECFRSSMNSVDRL